MGVKCFFIEPTERCEERLRRYARGDDKCLGRYSFHNAETFLRVVDRSVTPGNDAWPALSDAEIPHDDSRWPVQCDGCSYVFTESDHWTIQRQQIYVDKATGLEHRLSDQTPGMMWDAFWMHRSRTGPDSRYLCVVCPNGRTWEIDSRCSNCALPDDNEHRCWIRHGEPPNLIVDKNGKTCAAGAGSIQAGDYHGFLGQGTQPGWFT